MSDDNMNFGSVSEHLKKKSELSKYISDIVISYKIDNKLRNSDYSKLLDIDFSQLELWMSGYYNFTIQDIAKIETKLNIEIISIKEKK